MVSAEIATTVPAIILVLALALTSLRVGMDQVRCVDAARAGARAAARGDDPSTVDRVAHRAAPAGSTVEIAREGGDVVVTVTAPSPIDVPLIGSLPAPVSRAVTPVEGNGP